ncbi:glycoside hydrolase family 5 protein [Saccharata proteae CBS 121410]|uniref:Glycoside hydrolase family 5 protein n=1 Tax=Saccharata proteae CBS 121410 TaxID=1314787 RepID=A0A9P4I1G0_9PEZI|nr:glycoside hydrolase family 5 protein [Saccharata proteae CBS 121410]
MTLKLLLPFIISNLAAARALPIDATTLSCSDSFSPISASEFAAALNPGWNLGNTLDAVKTEGDWNNAPVVASTFDDVQAAGFKSVRLPVTWAYHFTSESPDWTVNSTWLQRVSDVVDMVITRGLHAIVNVHHDSWIWADFSASDANITMIEEKFYRLWYQIGTELGCKSSLLAFEPLNEPVGTTETQAAELNKLNNIFLQAINDAGGFNAERVVTLVGLGEDSIKTSEWFEPPNASFSNPWAIQFHYYSPYDFISSAWGKTIWGSDADKSALSTDFSLIRNNFSDIPLVIGEWAASPVATETAARWKYFDYLVRAAAEYDIATILWDNGNDFLDRTANTWRDQTALDIYMAAVDGEINSLPDSTEDSSATSQWTSAYLFHQAGTDVVDQSLPFLFNGNTLTGATVGDTALAANTDYSVSGSNITFRASFLSNYFSPQATTGIKANLTLSFTAGADLELKLVQWDTPVLSTSSSAAVADTDLSIPITWNGIAIPATVRALESDGTYLVDSFTVYYGPLQQARTTYSSQWNWDDSHVIITSAAIDAVISAGKDTTFTIETYPRVAGNSVNYTVTM